MRAVAQKCAASLNIDGYTQPAQCAAFRVQDSLIVSNKEHQSSSEDATQNTFSRFANIPPSCGLRTKRSLPPFKMKPLTVADIIPTMSFHTSNSVSSTHQAFRFTEDPESAQLFLSVDSLQCRRPSFPQSATTSGPLKSVYTSYGSKLDKSMGCYKAVAQHDVSVTTLTTSS
ncbi:Uncharacterized protein HZ326_5025 [Fusarium oxysporum f. sp. albedinis]|nr:Uncharacterized protein HZ326_5025 [Fusarium oxysporum f. sp. albedinis]